MEVFRVMEMNFGWIKGGDKGIMIKIKIGWVWMVLSERWKQLMIVLGMLMVKIEIKWEVRRQSMGFYMVEKSESEQEEREEGVRKVRVSLIEVEIQQEI